MAGEGPARYAIRADELRWWDLDLDGATTMSSQQLQQYDGHLTLCPPKTSSSQRLAAARSNAQPIAHELVTGRGQSEAKASAKTRRLGAAAVPFRVIRCSVICAQFAGSPPMPEPPVRCRPRPSTRR
ncbi:MAG: hypothetical protein ACM32E_29040 [Gemmatimonadota bacterium]